LTDDGASARLKVAAASNVTDERRLDLLGEDGGRGQRKIRWMAVQ
jgi:hypothetical protein